MNRTDHDTLVRLEVMVNQIGTDIKDLKDGMTVRLVGHDGRLDKHELRLNKIEAMIQSAHPEQTMGEFRVVQQQVHDFQTTVRTLWITTSIVSGLIAFLFSQLPVILKAVGVAK